MRIGLLISISFLCACAHLNDRSAYDCRIESYRGGYSASLMGLINPSEDFENELRLLLPASIRDEAICWYIRSDGKLVGDSDTAGYLFALDNEYWYYKGTVYEKVLVN